MTEVQRSEDVRVNRVKLSYRAQHDRDAALRITARGGDAVAEPNPQLVGSDAVLDAVGHGRLEARLAPVPVGAERGRQESVHKRNEGYQRNMPDVPRTLHGLVRGGGSLLRVAEGPQRPARYESALMSWFCSSRAPLLPAPAAAPS